jgi:diacylglycerol O-acyltransferase / wax synthase
MQRLGPQDASFLYLETRSVHQHVGSVTVLDPATAPARRLTYADVARVIGSRLHLVPRFRQRVVFPPLAVGRPVWVDDPGFDLDFHIRKAGLPAPGSRKDLAEYVQRVISRPLDRTKPLWEAYVIEGLEDDLVAVLTKVHHAMVDGVSAIDIATVLLDFTPEPQMLTSPPWRPRPAPAPAELFVDSLRDTVAHPLVGLAGTIRAGLATPQRLASDMGQTLGGIVGVLERGMAPPSPFNRKVGPNRRFAMIEAPVSTFKDVKRALGGTVNDVILAAVAGAMARLFRLRKLPVRGRSLRAMIPVSVRPKSERMAMGNQVSAIFVDLPIGPMGAARRLRLISEATKDIKESNQAMGAEFLMNIGTWAPPTLHALAARLAVRTRLINLVVSNVPGPQMPLYIAGARVLASYPTMPLAEEMGLAIATTSLAGTMAFGITADWDSVPDIDALASALEESIQELQKAAGV